jgi:hypothetical protein
MNNALTIQRNYRQVTALCQERKIKFDGVLSAFASGVCLWGQKT